MNEESHVIITRLCHERGFVLTILKDHYAFFNPKKDTMVHLFINKECLVGDYGEKEFKLNKKGKQKYSKIGSEKKNIYDEKRNTVVISNAESSFYDEYTRKHFNGEKINLLVVRIPCIKFLNKNIAFGEVKTLELERNENVFVVQYIGYPEEEIERIMCGDCGWGCCGIDSITHFDIISTRYSKRENKYCHLLKRKG